MKRHILIILFFALYAFGAVAFAEDKDSLYLQATQAYGKEDYESAIRDFSKIIEISENPTAEMYYNLAGAYYKGRHLGEAVLNYERAYRLNPADSDTKHNLRFLSTQIEDKIVPSPGMVVRGYVDAVTHWFALSTWVVLTIFFFSLCTGLVLLYLLGNTKEKKLGGFYGAIVALFFTLFCLTFTLKSNSFIHDTTEAILTKPVISLKSSPDNSAKTTAVLHSGLKVTVGRRVSGFYEVTLADGVVGWAPIDALTFVNPGF